MRLRELERAIVAARRPEDGPVYVVGGAVRDAQLRRPIGDADLAVRSGEETLARRLSAEGWGSAFALSPPGSPVPVWRVASPKGTIDVARFESGDTIERDLARRDFTVNAMARAAGSRAVIDPFGGRRDLERGVVRAISEANLRDDPLRVLRGYRIAAVRGWRIDRRTRLWLARAASGLGRTAPERVHEEIVRLFGAADPRAIGWAAADGALASPLGLPSEPPVLRAAQALAERRKSEGAPAVAALRIALLFHAAATGPEQAAERLGRAKFSRTETREVTGILRFLDRAFSSETPVEVLFPYRAHLPPLLRAAEAAARGRTQRERARALRAAGRRVSRGEAPVDGRELARWLDLSPGPELGRWLDRARFGWFSRQWLDRSEMKRALIARRFDPANSVG
jgi:tRNA nucleotidyltransferase/poly(A) polymerase